MKSIAYIICYCIYPFSFLLPRSKKKWAFGTSHYAFADNAKYFFIYASEHSEAECVWLTFNRSVIQEVRSKGLKAYSLLTPKGIWFALTSKYWFFNSYVSDILFCLSGKAVRVNMWHGVPIKQIEFDVTSGPLVERYVKQTFKERFYHPESFCRPDYILAPSDRFVKIFSSAFRVTPQNCLKCGVAPRNNLLIKPETERQVFIRRYETEGMKSYITLARQYATTYIYMPTWRESQRNIFTQSMNLSRLNELLKQKNELLFLKPHVNTTIDKTQHTEFSNIQLIPPTVDVYPLLPYTDVLITDYSSVMYDYILMENKRIVLYLYDYEQYKKGERNFYYPYDENTIGEKVFTFDELCAVIQRGVVRLDEVKRKDLLTVFWGDNYTVDSSLELITFFQK